MCCSIIYVHATLIHGQYVEISKKPEEGPTRKKSSMWGMKLKKTMPEK